MAREGKDSSGRPIYLMHASSDILLPDELIAEILLRLDLKDVLRFRYVSKSWHALINNPYFIEKHVRSIESRAKLDLIIEEYQGNSGFYKVDINDERLEYNAVKHDGNPTFGYRISREVVGSCNGLVCWSDKLNRVGIWNSSTRYFHELPPMPIQSGGLETRVYSFHVYGFGFGHDRITDDHKVIGIAKKVRRHDSAHIGLEARVYSLKNRSWAKQSQYIMDKDVDIRCGTFASISNGIYWIMHQNYQRRWICAFDIRIDHNGYHEVQLPDYKPKNGSNYIPETCPITLGVLRGCLCLFSCNYLYSSDLWVMKESAWTRLISFSYPFPNWNHMRIKPLTYSRSASDNKLLLHDGYSKKLMWYDLENKTAKIVKLHNNLHVGEVCLHQGGTYNFSSDWRKLFGCLLCLFLYTLIFVFLCFKL